MLNRNFAIALAVAMVLAVLYGCSGSDNSGLKNDLAMYKEQVGELETKLAARITPEAEQALREALGEMELTPETLAMLVARADLTQGAYDALVGVLPAGTDLTPMTLSELAGRAALTKVEYANLMAELGPMMPLTVATLRSLVGRADITADAYQGLMDALPGMELTEMTLSGLADRADITAVDYQGLVDAMGMMDLTVANIEQLLGRADITVDMYQALMTAAGMDLTVQNLTTLADRAGITAADYQGLVAAMGGMALDVATLEMLVARADITQAQYNALTAILPTLNETSLGEAVTMANQYTALLAALDAAGMSHTDALELARRLVAEDAAERAVNDNRVARKIGALVRNSKEMTEADLADINAMLEARFGMEVVDMRKAAVTGSGLSVGMLENPGLQLDVAGTMVPARTPAVTPEDFEGAALFNEDLPGGRHLMTYAYTDVRDPWTETFEEAYGRLADATHPGDAPMVVADPGMGPAVTQEQTETYDTYVAEKAMYDQDLAAYERAVAQITQDDFVGHPKAGEPSNTPDAMRVMETGTESESHFWSLSRIDTLHLPVPPPRGTDSAIVITDPLPVEAQYREEGHADGTSMLSGSFDGVSGNFICATEAAGGMCTIGAVRTDKTSGDRVRNGVEYSFEDNDTWSFVADDPLTATVTTLRKDGDYLVMGWWLEAPQASTGDFKFGRFFAGSDPFDASDIAALEGSAVYNGSAVGKYATRDVGETRAEKGLFTATAELTASFVEDDISGTITDFMDDSGTMRPGWHVTLLGSAAETATADFDGSAFVGVTRGEADGRDWWGNWNGEFYGNSAGGTLQPTSVAGLFNATFGCPESSVAGCLEEADPRPADTVGDQGFVGVSGVFGAHR